MSCDFGFDPTNGDDYYFISYNSEDADRVGAICRALNDRGLPMWYDRGLENGESWRTGLSEKIIGCREAIFFITRGIFEKARDRESGDVYTYTEFQKAEEYNKKRRIVWLDEVDHKDVPRSLEIFWIKLNALHGLYTAGMKPEKVVEEILRALGSTIASASYAVNAMPDLRAEMQADFRGELKTPIRYPNGSEYIGGWCYGIPDGLGRWLSADGQSCYSGGFLLGQFSGQGRMDWADGRCYTGEWRVGRPHGFGRMQDGDEEYYGEWRGGIPEGRCDYYLSHGDVYAGEWRNGQPEGKGKMVYADGSVYEGEWRAGKHEGEGRITLSDGDVYEGEWKDDKPDGKGKMVYADGKAYEGEWKNNKPHGHGRLVYADGSTVEGEWKNGELLQ